MTSEKPFRDLVTFARGGGWGSESPQEGHELVAIIRGTDFDAVRSGQLGGVPRRWEKGTKLPQRLLKANDIVLEISGGSSAKGQSTGRSIFISNSILDGFEIPVIPASFCRIVRVDGDIVFPRYAYYGLQDMYKSRRAAEYENQSTGISNFQFERFLDAEYLRLPPMFEQQAIAAVLGALDDKIAVNERIASVYEQILALEFELLGIDIEPGEEVSIRASDLVEFNPKLPPPSREDAVYLDMASLPTSTARVQGWSRRAPKSGTRFSNGDTVMARITPCLENGKTAFVDFMEDGEIGVGSTEFIVMRACPNVPTHFPYFLARSSRFRKIAIQNMVGSSGRQRVSAAQLADVPLARPDRDSLAKFGDRAAAAFAHMKSLGAENQTLAQLRDTLLPKLMSGELRVRDAEKMVEDAT